MMTDVNAVMVPGTVLLRKHCSSIIIECTQNTHILLVIPLILKTTKVYTNVFYLATYRPGVLMDRLQ